MCGDNAARMWPAVLSKPCPIYEATVPSFRLADAYSFVSEENRGQQMSQWVGLTRGEKAAGPPSPHWKNEHTQVKIRTLNPAGCGTHAFSYHSSVESVSDMLPSKMFSTSKDWPPAKNGILRAENENEGNVPSVPRFQGFRTHEPPSLRQNHALGAV